MNNLLPKGQAALLSVLFIFVMGLLTVDGVSNVTIGNIRTATDIKESMQSYYAAEGVLEDAILRVIESDIQDPTSGPIINGALSTTTIISVEEPKTISVISSYNGRTRILESILEINEQTVNFENGLQAGQGGISINNSATVTGDVCSEGDFIGSSTNVTGKVNVIKSVSPPLLGNESQKGINSEKFGDTNNTMDAAQEFTSQIDKTILTRVAVFLKRVGNPGDLNLRILPNKSFSGGFDGPDNRANALTSVLITEESVSVSNEGDWVVIALDDPVNLNPEEKYWIVLDRTSNDSTGNYWEWFTNSPLTGTGLIMRNWSHNSNPVHIEKNTDFIYKVALTDEVTELLKVQGVNANGPIYADLIIDSSAGGTVCPLGDCHDAILESCNGDTLTLQPEMSSQILGWIDEAENHGIPCSEDICNENGDLIINEGRVELNENTVIEGDLNINQTGELLIDGTIWVKGSFTIGNSGRVILGGSLITNKGGQIIVGSKEGNSGGDVSFSNSAYVDGSGVANLLVLSLKQAPGVNSITLNNTAGGDVFFVAPETCIRSSNNTNSKALVAYCLNIDNAASINYESALGEFFANTPFTGNTLSVKNWREIFIAP